MSFWTALRVLLLALASFGYFANGAQAHVQISTGETVSVAMCSSHQSRSFSLELPGEPAEETKDTCCGDCMSMAFLEIEAPRLTTELLQYAKYTAAPALDPITPRSPLWPGAPPLGPPPSRKI